MRRTHATLVALFIAASSFALPALAGDTTPLFVNLTTSKGHRAKMAITFGTAQLERGHPLTIFLNDKGVLLASKSHRPTFAAHQKALVEVIGKGASVIVCSMCMREYGVKEHDLLPGIQVGKPELTGSALFKDGTTTLTW